MSFSYYIVPTQVNSFWGLTRERTIYCISGTKIGSVRLCWEKICLSSTQIHPKEFLGAILTISNFFPACFTIQVICKFQLLYVLQHRCPASGLVSSLFHSWGQRPTNLQFQTIVDDQYSQFSWSWRVSKMWDFQYFN